MKKQRIVIWRHGQTDWNIENRFQGHSDISLNSVGVGQAKRSAAILAGMNPTKIISSDLDRAFKTATELDLHGDVPELPSQFKNVLIDGAVYHLYMMRDNVELASLSNKLVTDGIDKMRQILINRYIRMRDTRVSSVIND